MNNGNMPIIPDTLSDLLAEAMTLALPGMEASDTELSVAAEQGLEAIPECDRSRVMRAIASNHDGAAAAAILHAELLEEASLSENINKKHTPRSVDPGGPYPFIYRVNQVGLAMAACLALFFGIQMMITNPSDHQATFDSQGSAPVEMTSPAPEIGETTTQDSKPPHDGNTTASKSVSDKSPKQALTPLIVSLAAVVVFTAGFLRLRLRLRSQSP